MVLYFTPKGQYISGYTYKNGNLITQPQTSPSSGGQQIQSIAGHPLQVDVAEPPDCTDWYMDYYENGVLIGSEYIGTTCSGTGTETGGGSAPPPPCLTSGSGNGDASVRRLTINVAEPPPGGGDGGMPPPVDECTAEPDLDPCIQANTLTANQTFISKMNYLKSIMNTPGETTDVMEPNGTFKQQTDPTNGGASQQFANSYFNGSTGFLHNHGKGPGILSVFSPADIATLHTIITKGGVANPSSYTFALVNQDGQSYLLTVSNMTNFNNWANTYLSNDSPNSIFYSLYNNLVSSSNSDAVNENNFVTLLTNTTSGLTLMKGNATNTSWSQVVKNSNGTISIIPCNY